MTHDAETSTTAAGPIPEGVVVSVRGAVVDVTFRDGALPQIDPALTVGGDRPEPLLLEVHSHVDTSTVRAIALQATAGLARGTAVRAVGRRSLSRSARRCWAASWT